MFVVTYRYKDSLPINVRCDLSLQRLMFVVTYRYKDSLPINVRRDLSLQRFSSH